MGKRRKSMVSLDSGILKKLMQEKLFEKGVNDNAVHHAVSSLIQTSLRGVDSHGINLFPHYCRAVDSGRINKKNEMVINRTAASTAIVDAKDSFGHHSGAVAMDYAIELAAETGIAAVNVTNSTHFGAAAYFALRAAEKNMLGFSFTNADALVKAFNSQKAFFGTNPICFTAPLLNEEPLCLDMATSLVSWNKINNYRRTNEAIPAHWAYDENGISTTDPHIAKSLSPAGEYKGFGLGMMVDILCAVITGGLISKDILPMYNSPIEAQRKISHFFMAIDIQKFSSPDTFKANLQSMADRIRMLPKLSEEEVMVPGDPEKKQFAERIKSGIPMDDIKFGEFMEISNSFENAVIS
jgi:ureidoglycolate dehydrogenase (NAD+)